MKFELSTKLQRIKLSNLMVGEVFKHLGNEALYMIVDKHPDYRKLDKYSYLSLPSLTLHGSNEDMEVIPVGRMQYTP